MNDQRNKVLADAVQTWGRDAQTLMMIEEMSELTKAICKFYRTQDDSGAEVAIESIREKRKVPVCGKCQFMNMTGWAICNGNNNGNNNGKPRGYCWCEHPDALETFKRVCPKSSRAPGFIDFTPKGGNKPKIKTSPRWCPLRLHWFPVKETDKEA